MGSYEILPVGDKLKNLREKYNVRQDDLAGGEITRNLISQIEHGKANLTKNAAEIILKNLKKICYKKHITIDEDIEYLMEDEKSQANKILDKYIKELKDLTVYKDGSFISKLGEVEEFLVKWNITDKKIRIFELAGDYFISMDDYHKSSLYYEKAKALMDIHSKDSISILRKLSMAYFYMGEYEQGIKCCQFALDWFTNDLTEEYRCIFLFNSALCNLKLEEYDQALENLTILEPIVKDLNTNKYYEILIQKAVCLQYQKKYSESLNLYDKILNFINQASPEKYTHILVNVTEIYIELGNYDKAKAQLNIILNNITKLDKNCQHLAGIHCELGKIYRDLNDLNTAEKYFLKSLSLAKKQTYYFLIKDIIWELISIYKIANNIKKVSEIKSELFILISKEGNLNIKLVLELIDLYAKLGDTQSVSEVIDFSKKFV